MNKLKISILYLNVIAMALGCASGERTPSEILNNTVRALNEQATFEYEALYKIRQHGMTTEDTTKVYIEKSTEQGLLPLKYIFESASGDLQLFDGQSFNTIIDKERTIVRTESPPSYLIVSNYGLLYSPFYIQRFIGYLIENDPSAIRYAGDTIISNQKAAQFEISTDYIFLLDGQIVRNGDLLPNGINAENINKRYILTIDIATFHPLSIMEFQAEGDFTKVDFSSTDGSTLPFEDRAKGILNETYLTLNTEDYMQIQMAKQMEIVGTPAKDFTLPKITSAEISLSDLSKSPVLLEFWFPGCAFCIEAVPFVNSIFEKYKNAGLKVFGIEFSNVPADRISNYIDTHKVEFPILMKGKNTSMAYGINSGPTFVLLDKNHKVVYLRSGLDYQELIVAIEKVL